MYKDGGSKENKLLEQFVYKAMNNICDCAVSILIVL